MTPEAHFFTLSLDALYILGTDGYFQTVNPAFGKLLGRPTEELLANPFTEFMHPDDRAVTLEAVEKCRTGIPITSLENRFQCKDGSYRWFEWTIYPALAEGGMYGIGRDITSRKQVEEAQRDAEERLRMMVESVKDYAIFSLNPEGCIASWNTGAERVFGYTEAEIVGQKSAIVFTPEDRASGAPAQEIKTAAETGRAEDERWHLRKDGSRFFASGILTPIRDETGALRGFTKVARDMTERKQVEEELQINRDRLDLAIKASELGTFYCDMPLDKIIWNDRCKEQFWLLPEAEVNFDLFYSIIHPDDRKRTREAIEACIYGHKGYDIEYRTVATDGRIRWVRAIGNCFYNESNEPMRFDGITIDVTDRKKAEDEREKLLESERAARSEAERASRLKDEFLLTLSHELRTPLNAILGWSQLLRRGTIDAAKMAHGLDIIERNVRAQAQLIDDLLDMSRVISGKLRLNVQRIQLGSVIEAALETVRLSAEAKDIHLQKILDPLAGIVSGDPARLEQIIWNLLSNAIKFTPKGGRVQVILARANSQIEISVIDTGQGINPEFLPYVFDRFRQADASTTRNHGGLGLGLAIVKNLTELHGGSVRVESAGEGKGTTFTITLPLAGAHPEEVTLEDFGLKAARTTSIDDPQLTLNGVKVLVVDDEPDARELIRVVLEGCYAEVITAASAEQALEVLKHEQPDVLVSDIGMPQEDGYQFIHQVRTLPPNKGGKIPAVALTAYAGAEDRKRALLSGYQMYVAKPVEPSELIAVVSTLTSLMLKGQEDEP